VKFPLAEFTAAAASPAEIPRGRAPEVALAGRSNVGKSSLINKLTGRRKLARTSQTPGCTRGLNFYALDDRLALVDLPGYGWARRSKQERDRWKVLVEHYLEKRDVLAGVLILVDARRGAEKEELMLAEYLAAAEIPYVWVLTKSDKLKRAGLAAAVLDLSALPNPRPAVATSAQTGGGIDQLWRAIGDLLDAGRAKRSRRA
jgi:GTP-binding protein